MAQTNLRNNRAERLRRKRKRRRQRIKTVLIFILTAAALISGVKLAKSVRYSGMGNNGSVPLLLQTDDKWNNLPYGSSTVGISGCGPTCLSMVITALTDSQNMTPDAVADFSAANGYYVDGVGTSWSLMSDGARRLGLKVKEISLDEGIIADKLEHGYPIICSVTKGDFTNEGHFIVLTSYNDGIIHVNDPNSSENSAKDWSYERLKGQINNLWVYGK